MSATDTTREFNLRCHPEGATVYDVDYLLERLGHARYQVYRLTSALERTQDNFVNAVKGRPVRDMDENLAENANALSGDAL